MEALGVVKQTVRSVVGSETLLAGESAALVGADSAALDGCANVGDGNIGRGVGDTVVGTSESNCACLKVLNNALSDDLRVVAEGAGWGGKDRGERRVSEESGSGWAGGESDVNGSELAKEASLVGGIGVGHGVERVVEGESFEGGIGGGDGEGEGVVVGVKTVLDCNVDFHHSCEVGEGEHAG